MFVVCTSIATTAVILTLTLSQTMNPTLHYWNARDFQNWYMERVEDTIPLMETIKNCEDCPRVYIPVCGFDNKTYTNLCKMNCMNKIRGTDVAIQKMGRCVQFLFPFEY